MRCVDWFRPASGSSRKRLQLPYPVHLLLGIPDQIWTRGGSLSHLHPTNRRSTWPPIQSLIGRHLYTRLITVVVDELCQGQVLILATLEVQDACSQHVLQNLDSPLSLSVRLRMKHYAHPHLCSHGPLETPPELSREPEIPIRYDRD